MWERAIAEFLQAKHLGRSNRQREAFSNENFIRISDMLKKVGKLQWSLLPRTYAILKLSGRLDAMDLFVDDGLTDISLPYTTRTLHAGLRDHAFRSKFLELQSFVLNEQAKDRE